MYLYEALSDDMCYSFPPFTCSMEIMVSKATVSHLLRISLTSAINCHVRKIPLSLSFVNYKIVTWLHSFQSK
jgi:hypothetical protein